MRGDDNQQEGMFSYVSPEKRVPTDPGRVGRQDVLFARSAAIRVTHRLL
jgi:hypothetical protein